MGIAPAAPEHVALVRADVGEGAKSETFDASLELARGDVLSSPLLPGFALALGELFGPQA